MRLCRLISVFLLLLLVGCGEPRDPVPLVSAARTGTSTSHWTGTPAAVEYYAPAHPYMAAQGRNSMHSDSFNSDVHPSGGPVGENTTMVSRKGTRAPGGQCANMLMSSEQRVLVLCAGITGFRIQMLEHRTLRLLADYKLPNRSSTWQSLWHRDKRYVMEDSSGAYFYLDHEDRVVVADNVQRIHRIAHQQSSTGQWEFVVENLWDLSSVVPGECFRPTYLFPDGECDQITALLPDYHGLIWWVTRGGRVGTLNTKTGGLQSVTLADEEIQNGFAVARDGVYIVSDHALYAFHADSEGVPVVRWQESYDRGSARRLGAINQGSGTTPTLMGDHYITLTDNADGRSNLLVYKRTGSEHDAGRLLCKQPVFQPGRSVAENSMIAVGRTILLENNTGYTSAEEQKDWSEVGGGIVRIDLREDESGCDVIWESQERIPSVVAKLAARTGIAYYYTFEENETDTNAWYLIGIDINSGETVFRIYTGNGAAFNNNWAPIALTQDGTAYIGTSKGLLALWDST